MLLERSEVTTCSIPDGARGLITFGAIISELWAFALWHPFCNHLPPRNCFGKSLEDYTAARIHLDENGVSADKRQNMQKFG